MCGEALLEAVLSAHEAAEAPIPHAFPPLLVQTLPSHSRQTFYITAAC